MISLENKEIKEKVMNVGIAVNLGKYFERELYIGFM